MKVDKDRHDEEILELKLDKVEMLNCIVQKILLMSKFKEDAPLIIRCET